MAEENELIENASSSRRGCCPNFRQIVHKSPQFDPLPILPYEIIAEILSRLPVRTLIRFRCVSKSFRSLISDPKFIDTHIRKIKSSLEYQPDLYQRLAFIHSDPVFWGRQKISCCSLYSIFSNSQTEATELDHFLLEDRDTLGVNFQLVGSCDGLMCATMLQFLVVLWNPSTRVFNKMPDLDFEFKKSSYTVFGFGYDSEIDDYKVVAIHCSKNSSPDVAFGYESYDTRVKICSRKTKCWRSIEDFKYGVPDHVPAKFVNGSLCFSAKYERDSVLTWIIVSLDLATEAYTEIMQPNCEDFSYYDDFGYGKSLGVLNGCVCLMCTDNDTRTRADIWVMKEFAVAESWTKLASVPYSFHHFGYFNLNSSFPLYVAENGEILLELKMNFHIRLVIYDPKDCTFRFPVIKGAGELHDSGIYFLSLVSPIVEN